MCCALCTGWQERFKLGEQNPLSDGFEPVVWLDPIKVRREVRKAEHLAHGFLLEVFFGVAQKPA